MIEDMIRGAARFRRRYHRKNRQRFAELVREGQKPHTLFITCADSRILPANLTDSGPGELFVIRNVGNMVPPYGGEDACASTAAGIEYAVSVLGVRQIVVCGHSYCGACAALHEPELPAELRLTQRWLDQGAKVTGLIRDQAVGGPGAVSESEPSSVRRAGANDRAAGAVQRWGEPASALFISRKTREQILRATERAMIVQHLGNLMSYPAVARKVAAGGLSLHGWYYQIDRGRVDVYDPQRLAFVPLAGNRASRDAIHSHAHV